MTVTRKAWTPQPERVFMDSTGQARPMYMADLMGCEDAPLPLARFDAIMRASDLNQLGFDWPAVALVMEHYHGWYLKANSWRSSVGKWAGRRRGLPRGVPFDG